MSTFLRAVPAKLRTVVVKVSPAPATLSERRAILRVLKRHGTVDVFKRLHDPSHFISILERPEVASALVNRSPIEFDYVKPRRGDNDNHDLNNDDTDPENTTAASPPPNSILENHSNPLSPPPKTFLVKIVPQPGHTHMQHIRDALIYGRWPVPPPSTSTPTQQQQHQQPPQESESEKQDRTRDRATTHLLFTADSLPKQALSQTVPPGMAHAGFTDWESCGQLEEGEDLSTMLVKKKDYVATRWARKIREGKGGGGLVGAWEAREAKEAKAREAKEAKEGKKMGEGVGGEGKKGEEEGKGVGIRDWETAVA